MGAEESAVTPVIIGHRQPPAGTRDMLLNLAWEVPGFFQHFAEILEPIDQDPAVREAGRARFRHYRTQGLEVLTHNDFTF
ncbi:DNA polymerase III subunit chi [Gammaproteobacteria bacterium]